MYPACFGAAAHGFRIGPGAAAQAGFRGDLKQPVIFGLDHAITFAGTGFEASAVNDVDVTPAVLDQTGKLQFASGFGDRFTTHAEKTGDQFLSHVNLQAG